MNELLDLNSNGVRIVGIHGMGGIGKTTISKVIYNHLCELFECCCFLEDVRENSRHPNGLTNLKKELISKIRKGKDFLIVLDDVNETSQFDKLVGKGDEFGSRGRIIITTRNTEVLDILGKKHSPEVYRSYEPLFMNSNDSLQLFSKHAFLKNSPPTDYYELAENIVNTTGGLPLVLVTIGSLLFGKEGKAYWKETLKRLKKIPNKDVFERLKISYDSLDTVEQEIFLDIACLRRNIKEFRYMWEDLQFFPKIGIDILIGMSLIKVGDDGEIWMHDQIRDLGRKIAEHNRLSLSTDACDVLESCTGKEEIVALKLFCLPHEDVVGEHLMKLRNLRYLRVVNVNFVGDSKNLKLSNLRWLDCCLIQSNLGLPNFQLKNLVILELSSYNISDDWEGWSQIKMATKLKVLHLSDIDSLERLDCSAFATLERLKLWWCSSLRILDGLEELKSLTYLNTSGCDRLERLSDISNLENLKELKISYCSELSEIGGLSGLKSLERLDMSMCISIERLPDLSKLKMLKELNTRGCRELREVEGLTVLESLEHLILDGKSVQGILDLSNLKKLKKLRAFGLELTEIQVPKELKWLEVLEITGCPLIEKLPDLSNFENLEKIDASNCEKLTEIEGLEKLKSLVVLDITGCRSIKQLPDLSNLKNLKQLLASNCYQLTEIRGLEELNSLEELDIDGCKSIEKLCDLSALQVLRALDVSGCEKLTEIMGLEVLKSLKELSIEGCNSIGRLPDLSNLEVLEVLDVSGCEKLTEIMGIEELESLKELSIKGCNSIERLPDLSNLEVLQKLDASGCEKLTEIMGLEVLKSLRELSIKGCNSIERLPDLTKLTNLRMFNGIRNKELWSIHERRDSFITHRAFWDALAQESARTPPTLSTIGSQLYRTNNMSLGLSQVGHQISSAQDQHQTSNDILRLGIPQTGQFGNLIGQSMSSAFQPMQNMNSSSFFMPEQNQVYQEENQTKFQGLLQFPEIQNHADNTPSGPSLFNLGFFSNSSNTSSIDNSNNNSSNNLSSSSLLIPNPFTNGSGNDSSNLFHDNISSAVPSLFGTSVQNNHNAASHMSATALLQKAAQLGSSTSTKSANNFGSFFGLNNDNNLQDLMNSLAGGNSSIFGGGSGDQGMNQYGGNENEDSYEGYNGKKIKLEQSPLQNRHHNLSFGRMEQSKLHHNLSANDTMTRDFLGVGEIVRSMSGGIDMSSLDSERKTAPKSQAFGGANFQ